ncbi:hypothetical protein V3C99_000090, partial [Haemonchus contortus]
ENATHCETVQSST